MSKLSESVADYCNSEHFLFLNPDLKEHAEALLAHWCDQVGDDVTTESIRAALRQVAMLDAPAEARKAFPEVLREYLQYLESSGLLPGAGDWAEQVSHLESRHSESFRTDGSVRGQTYRKKFTDVGRNQPCPCGSGKKFKKCCMALLT